MIREDNQQSQGILEAEVLNVISGEEPQMVELSKDTKLNIMGHTFHGIEDIMAWKGEEPVILEKYKLFPCFDSYDYASENRFYHNYLFCLNKDDAALKKVYFDAIPKSYGCIVDQNYPRDLRPLVYYADESASMTLYY